MNPRRIQQEVYQYWEENYGLDGWEHGVQVFFDEVDLSNEILIVGNQPGVGEDGYDFEQKEYADYKAGSLSPPSGHDYLPPTKPIENGMKKILGENFEKVIRNSVKTNFNFFRAKEDEEAMPQRDAIEEFCLEKVEELRNAMDPEVVIFEGIGSAWEEGEQTWGFESRYTLRREGDKSQRLLIISEQSDTLGIAVYHPSYHPSKFQSDVMSDIIGRELSPVTDLQLTHPRPSLNDAAKRGEKNLALDFDGVDVELDLDELNLELNVELSDRAPNVDEKDLKLNSDGVDLELTFEEVDLALDLE